MAGDKKRNPAAVSWIDSVAAKNKYLDRLMRDGHFRLLTTTALGGGWNFVYALYHLVLAVMYRSFWFLTMGVYYLTICAMRASALRHKTGTGEPRADKIVLKRNSLLTFLLAFIFTGIICLTIQERHNQVKSTVVAITIAAYTFYCVTRAILNLAQLRKERTVQRIMLRNCSMVCALGSLFGLERMLLGTFGNAADHFTLVMEAASGFGMFVIIVAFGINLWLLSQRSAAESI